MLRQLASSITTNIVRHTTRRWAAANSTTTHHWTSSSCRPLGTSASRLAQNYINNDSNEDDGIPRVLIETDDGRKFAVLDSRMLPNLKPSIVKRRIQRLKTYVGRQQNIRHSPWRLNLICQMIAGLPVEEASRQLQFCEKSRAPLVGKVLKNTLASAKYKDGLLPSQLEVAECFATKGTPLKRAKPMARGRMGKMTRPFAHMRMVIREIDFKLKIYQAKAYSEKKKWLNLFCKAQAEAAVAQAEREELAKYEERQRQIKELEEKEQSKK